MKSRIKVLVILVGILVGFIFSFMEFSISYLETASIDESIEQSIINIFEQKSFWTKTFVYITIGVLAGIAVLLVMWIRKNFFSPRNRE